MNYQQILPSASLRAYIRFFWILEDDAPSGEIQAERIVPDGCAELIIHYGDKFRRFDGKDQWLDQRRCFIFGQIKKFIEIAPTGRTGILAARFTPFGIQPFIPFPAHELTGNAFTFTEIFGASGRELEEKLMNASDNSERIATLEKFLLKRLDAYRSTDLLIADCVNNILERNGILSIHHFTESYGLSERQLERRFSESVGMSPKVFSRVVRFQQVLQLLQSGYNGTLTTLAYECGYYDQSHFIRDFKAFSGQNPKKYFSDTSPFATRIAGF